MAAVQQIPEQAEREISRPLETPDIRSPIARLAALHAEAAETARLANLLGRSIHVSVALIAMAGLTLALGGAGWTQGAAWTVFILIASGAIALAYRRTIGQSFECAALKSFSRDMSAILVFAGFAWGAGAFLALPANANIGLLVLFTAGVATIVAVLLREQETLFLFLAPVAALASFACVLRPMAGGALGAGFVLIACATLAGAAVFAERRNARDGGAAELAGLPFA